jgi:hypothetical protein
MSNKENKTVFAEGQQVITSSPYEKYRNAKLEYITENSMTIQKGKKEKYNMHLECLKLSIMAVVPSEQPSIDEIVTRAKRFYQFAKTGE